MDTFQFLESDTGEAASEDQHQAAVVEWAAWNGGAYPALCLLFAIPNGGKRDARTAATLQRTGVKAGVPDLCLPVPSKGAHGLWVEMKKKGGRVDAKQAVWHERLRLMGYRVSVCYGADAAIRCIRNYLDGVAA